MTRAEQKRAEQKRAHAEAEAALKQAQKARDKTLHALLAFRAKYNLQSWDVPHDPELQVIYSQLKAAHDAAGLAAGTASTHQQNVLQTVPKPYLVKRWYEPPIPDDEE